MVYDKTDRESFDNVDGWINEVEKYSTQNQVKILVGNKSDMIPVVETAEAERKAAKYKMDYIETSAKEPYQVENLFEILANRLISDGPNQRRGGNRINDERPKEKKGGCCS